MVECEKIGRDKAEISTQGDGTEVYGRNQGLAAGNASEGTWILIRKPVWEYRRVRERIPEGDKLPSGVCES